MKIAFATFLTLFTLFSVTFASSGDRSPLFTGCVGRCNVHHCGMNEVGLKVWLRVTRWSCVDDCKYLCMAEITDTDVRNGKPLQQYYGKWPFYRFLGMQEPASVVFSLLNLWAHKRGREAIRRKISEHHPMRPYYLMWSAISINAWFWSGIFHTRDTPRTEKLDYFSAALSILYGLYIAILRLFHLYPLPQTSRLTLSAKPSQPSNSWKRISITILFSIMYIAHVSYLLFLPRFDYTYNIVFNTVLGVSHNILWAIYALPTSMSFIRRFPSQPKSYRPKFVSKAAWFVVLMTAATSLELFDFQPWARTIDAHSLWHLATAPIAFLWYQFLIEDSNDISWREQRL
ncbi:Protein PER1-like protein [Psilocybe cubensis]|uniref:Protein PER1-like protein n=2 Tax=Psilocybe cubensis TaxID=181762 RepID=A0ACB8H7G4_PSICU|nr:Protein PER1-like protein [Psilocybe cubensis]KAH9483617.1 Protein PER1-like protein [Psilocybe cubensis]